MQKAQKAKFYLSRLEASFPLTEKQSSVVKFFEEQNAQNILYGGAGGGGKSFLLRWFAVYLGLKYPTLQIYLFRLTYPELIDNHIFSANSLPAICETVFLEKKDFKFSKKDLSFEFFNGSRILLRHIDKAKLYKYQGSELNVALFDEATLVPEECLDFLFSRCRIAITHETRSFSSKFPLKVFATNPIGVSFLYFKREFVEKCSALEVFENKLGRSVFIPAKLEDNPFIDKESYVVNLSHLPEKTRQAILQGLWIEPENKFFDFNRNSHCGVFRYDERFPIYYGLDLGFSEPTAFVVLMHVTEAWQGLKPNTVVLLDELYLAEPLKPSRGLRLSLEETARRIAEFLTQRNYPLNALITTDLYAHTRNVDKDLFAIFSSHGLALQVKVRKRKVSFEHLNSRLREGSFLVNSHCHWAIKYLDSFGFDTKGNPQSDGEATHMVDAIRLALDSVPYMPVLEEEDFDEEYKLKKMLKDIEKDFY